MVENAEILWIIWEKGRFFAVCGRKFVHLPVRTKKPPLPGKKVSTLSCGRANRRIHVFLGIKAAKIGKSMRHKRSAAADDEPPKNKPRRLSAKRQYGACKSADDPSIVLSIVLSADPSARLREMPRQPRCRETAKDHRAKSGRQKIKQRNSKKAKPSIDGLAQGAGKSGGTGC